MQPLGEPVEGHGVVGRVAFGREVVRARIDGLRVSFAALSSGIPKLVVDGWLDNDLDRELMGCANAATAAVLELSVYPQVAAIDLFPPLWAAVAEVHGVAARAAEGRSDAGALQNYLEIGALIAGMADQVAQGYAAVAELPQELRDEAADWFDTHLPNLSDFEWLKTIRELGPDLGPSIGRYRTRKRDWLPTGTGPELLAATIPVVEAHPAIARLFPSGGVAARAAGKLEVLGEREFNTRYAKHRVARTATQGRDPGAGERLNDSAYRAILDLDTVLGFTDAGLMHLRDRGADAATCVHEMMHMLSDDAVRDTLGRFVNEGATEFITRRVCGSRIKPNAAAYPYNVLLVETLIDSGALEFDALVTAYFRGAIRPVQDAITEVSGAKGLAALRDCEQRTARATYDEWAGLVTKKDCVVQ